MLLWEELPKYMRTDAVRPYYDILKKKRTSIFIKRIFDLWLASTMLILMVPVFVIISVLIIRDSKGSIFFCQERVTQYGRKFKIYKFRTMTEHPGKKEPLITVQNDRRITAVGSILRKYRLDELPQLINIILGDMSFCGTRPESANYVKKYSPEMFATLLLPAGITSEASIHYKDEALLLVNTKNIDEIYVKKILPAKMQYNLDSIRSFSLFRELKTIIKTLWAVLH